MDIDKEGGIVDLGEHLGPSLSETRWIIKNIFQNNEHEYKKNSRLNTKIQSRIWSENRNFFKTIVRCGKNVGKEQKRHSR